MKELDVGVWFLHQRVITFLLACECEGASLREERQNEFSLLIQWGMVYYVAVFGSGEGACLREDQIVSQPQLWSSFFFFF